MQADALRQRLCLTPPLDECTRAFRPNSRRLHTPVRTADDSPVKQLTSLAREQLQAAFGVWGRFVPASLFDRVCNRHLVHFAEQLLEFDNDIARRGIVAAASDLLPTLVPEIITHGVDRIPTQGPLLIVSNHPGLYDAIALSACLPRDDLRVVAKNQPYWKWLPNLAGCLTTIGEGSGQFHNSMREMLAQLSTGGSLLLFPGGKIEPDPAHFQGSHESLDRWSRSPEWMATKLDQVTILPASISGVLSSKWLSHPLSWLRCSSKDSRWLAATLQFLLQSNRDVKLQISFGEPICVNRRNAAVDRKDLRQRIHHAVQEQLIHSTSL